jgi:hypothetical protein
MKDPIGVVASRRVKEVDHREGTRSRMFRFREERAVSDGALQDGAMKSYDADGRQDRFLKTSVKRA